MEMTILGFMASIQLAAYKMVVPGDWIAMPSSNADGTVLDISLTTVKVQNWDKTITTIPTYKMVANSFINWRGMEESGGRRIKRSFNIDMQSIKFCDNEMIERFKKIKLLENYINQKEQELQEYNLKNNITNTNLINSRKLTNIGIFRKYVEFFLRQNPNQSLSNIFLREWIDKDLHRSLA